MKRTLAALLVIGLAVALIYAFWAKGETGQGIYQEPSPPPVSTPSIPAPKLAPKPSSGISGTVTEGSSTRSVDGAKVLLFRKAKPDATKERNFGKIPMLGYLWAETRTNLAGRFHFDLPEPENYYLRLEKEGFAPTE